jgi:uncharacterized protein
MQMHLQKTLPESANFLRQVELNRKIEGEYPLTSLLRLSEALLENDGVVKAKLEFGYSVGFACLKASVSADLVVKCQRCLKPMGQQVTGSFKFALVSSEDEYELVPEEFEPYLLEGEEQSIIDLVEDELLLSMPMVMTHEDACSAFMKEQGEQIKAAREAAHPFAALKALRDDLDNNVN